MSVIDTLIIDRTLTDVLQRTAKGTYGAEDLNRVGEAVIYIAGRLRAAGYDVTVTARTDWAESEWLTPSGAAQMLENVSALRRQFRLQSGTPSVPPDMYGLNWTEANNIERILQAVDGLLTNIMTAWYFGGEVYSGEV